MTGTARYGPAHRIDQAARPSSQMSKHKSDHLNKGGLSPLRRALASRDGQSFKRLAAPLAWVDARHHSAPGQFRKFARRLQRCAPPEITVAHQLRSMN
jgi:hypothetical protein